MTLRICFYCMQLNLSEIFLQFLKHKMHKKNVVCIQIHILGVGAGIGNRSTLTQEG